MYFILPCTSAPQRWPFRKLTLYLSPYCEASIQYIFNPKREGGCVCFLLLSFVNSSVSGISNRIFIFRSGTCSCCLFSSSDWANIMYTCICTRAGRRKFYFMHASLNEQRGFWHWVPNENSGVNAGSEAQTKVPRKSKINIQRVPSIFCTEQCTGTVYIQPHPHFFHTFVPLSGWLESNPLNICADGRATTFKGGMSKKIKAGATQQNWIDDWRLSTFV